MHRILHIINDGTRSRYITVGNNARILPSLPHAARASPKVVNTELAAGQYFDLKETVPAPFPPPWNDT